MLPERDKQLCEQLRWDFSDLMCGLVGTAEGWLERLRVLPLAWLVIAVAIGVVGAVRLMTW